MGPDQVYDPVSLNQNKAERGEKESARQSVLLSRAALLFTVASSAYLFLAIQYRQKNDLQISTFIHSIAEANEDAQLFCNVKNS